MRLLALAAVLLFAAPSRADDTGVKRLRSRSYALGVTHAVGGALGDGIAYDSLRYSETNGVLMNATLGTLVRLVTPSAPARIECATGACTYLDFDAFLPMRNRVSGAMFGTGMHFLFDHAAIQFGLAIGFYGQDGQRHARDALVIGAKVPIHERVYARMRADFNIFGLYPEHVFAGYHKNSPISAGLTADIGNAFQATVDIERYDFLRGGVGGSIGLALRL